MNRFGTASLITRNTNDIQQIQLFLQMALMLMVIAPIMSVGGVIMALQEGLALSPLLGVAVPEARRFGDANASLTSTVLAVNRIFALAMPTLMAILNLASVAVLWFGGRLVSEGSMPIGNLTAFLTYILQILLSVMMAVMMVILVPRAAASADRLEQVLDTATRPAARIAHFGPRFRQLIDESAKFAIIGIAGVFVTNAVYDLLNLHLGLGPVTSGVLIAASPEHVGGGSLWHAVWAAAGLAERVLGLARPLAFRCGHELPPPGGDCHHRPLTRRGRVMNHGRERMRRRIRLGGPGSAARYIRAEGGERMAAGDRGGVRAESEDLT